MFKPFQLKNGSRVAVRTDSYNQGLVFSSRPLLQKELFEVTILRLDAKWSSSLMLGVTSQSPERIHPPVTGLILKKGAYVIAGCSVYHNGLKISDQFGPNLDLLQAGQKVGISIVGDELHLFVNNIDQVRVYSLMTSRKYGQYFTLPPLSIMLLCPVLMKCLTLFPFFLRRH